MLLIFALGKIPLCMLLDEILDCCALADPV